MDRRVIALIIISLLVLLLWPDPSVQYNSTNDTAIPKPVLEQPVQEKIRNAQPFILNETTITPLADFNISARVLGTEPYYFDRGAKLSPVDLALGWGIMSKAEVLAEIDISQRNRWYYWSTDRPVIPRRDIEMNSANMHMVPSNDHIADQLKSVKPGQFVQIRGKLIQADAQDGWRWRSSLTRNDTGGGACELIYVESIMLL